jgi:hypothetical protein
MYSGKFLTVPKNKDAEHALDYAQATADQCIEVSMTDAEYHELWAAKIFNMMNELTDAMIDDFESAEIVDPEKLRKVLNSDIFDRKVNTDKLQQIKRLFEEALERGTGVYFYF